MSIKPEDMTIKQLEQYLKTTFALPYGEFHWTKNELKIIAIDLKRFLEGAKKDNQKITVNESLMAKVSIKAREKRGLLKLGEGKKPRGKSLKDRDRELLDEIISKYLD